MDEVLNSWKSRSGAALVLVTLLTCCRPAAAVELGPVTLNGFLRYETFGYPDPTRGSHWENFLDLRVRSKGRVAEHVSYQLEARAVADDAQFTAGGFSPRNEDIRRPYLSLITAMLDFRPLPGLRVSIGKQIVNWSGFDTIQPANVMTPSDESDVFRSVDLGVYAVSARYQMSSTFAELVVVPLAFMPSRLPQGRWQFTPAGVHQRQDLPPVAFDETQAGLRLGTRIGGAEVAAIGYVGRDFQAIFNSQLESDPDTGTLRLAVIERYPRMHAAGFTASHPVGEHVLLRTESVYYGSPDNNRDDFLQTAAGAEYALRDWRFSLNYKRNDITAHASEPVTSQGERSFIRSFVFGEIRYDAGERLQARLRGGYDLTAEFFVLQPEVSWRLWQQLYIALVGEVIGADRPSYFHDIRHEDRVGTRLEYHF